MNRVYTGLLLIFVLISCKEEEITGLVLSSDKSEILADGIEQVTFKLKDSKGNDVTSEAQFFQNYNPFSGNIFKSDEAAEFSFHAEYNGEKSNSQVIVVNVLAKHVKNILVEDYTGTWCGYCPRVAKTLAEVLKKRNDVVAVAIHDDNEMRFLKVNTLKTEFNITGFPTGMIDRNAKWKYPETESGLSDALRKKAACGIAINSEVENTKGKVKIDIEFAQGYVSPCKLVVFATEDKLIYDQANFYPEYGSNPLKNYEHNHVLQLSLTNVLGDVIPDSGPNDYSKEFQFELGKMNAVNLSIVAFVVDSKSKAVLNARSVKLGEDAFFQYLD